MRRCALRCLALLLAVVVPLSASGTAVPVAAADSEQVAQLLDQLGVRGLLEQAPAVLAAAIEAEAAFRQEASSAANWRRDLEAQLKPPILLQGVTRYLQERVRADTLRQAQQRLQAPIVKRARYFDLAMTQPGADTNLRDFLAQQRAAPADAAVAERRALMHAIDAAGAASQMTATLQSAIAARVQLAAGGGAVDAALIEDAIAERQRYLAPLAADYLLYDYRYLRDDELRTYRDLLRDDAVQALLAVSREAVLAAILGEVTSSPVPPRSP